MSDVLLIVGEWSLFFLLGLLVLAVLGLIGHSLFDVVSASNNAETGAIIMQQYRDTISSQKAEKAKNLRTGDMVRAQTPGDYIVVGSMQNLLRDGKDNYFVLIGVQEGPYKNSYWFNMDNVEKVDQC